MILVALSRGKEYRLVRAMKQRPQSGQGSSHSHIANERRWEWRCRKGKRASAIQKTTTTPDEDYKNVVFDMNLKKGGRCKFRGQRDERREKILMDTPSYQGHLEI